MNHLVSFLVYSPGECPNQMVDFYVLDNSGSWMKQITTGPIVGEDLRLPHFLTTGEIVVLDSNTVTTCFHDPRLSSESVAFHPLWFQSYFHVESLVFVKGMTPFGSEGKSLKKKPGAKNRDEYLSEGLKLVLHFHEI